MDPLGLDETDLCKKTHILCKFEAQNILPPDSLQEQSAHFLWVNVLPLKISLFSPGPVCSLLLVWHHPASSLSCEAWVGWSYSVFGLCCDGKCWLASKHICCCDSFLFQFILGKTSYSPLCLLLFPEINWRTKLRFPCFHGVALDLINHCRPKASLPSTSLPVASGEHTDAKTGGVSRDN